jgi:hypothetical protein
MEAAATLTEVVKTQPQLMPLIGDLLFRSLDFPYSDQIAERLKKMLPPQLQDSAGDPTQKLMQAMQQMQQMGEQMKEMQDENLQLKTGAQAKMASVQVDSEEAKMKAQLAQQEAQAELSLQKQKQDGELQLAREKAEAEIKLKYEVAQADMEIERARCALENDQATKKLEFDRQCRLEDKKAESDGDDKVEAESLAPQMIESMKSIVAEFAQVIEGQQQFQQNIVAELSKKKTITAKSSSGMTMNATIN